ncbi:hypothetical protein KCU95_g3195, partial [Aureobasidium melanogenum]
MNRSSSTAPSDTSASTAPTSSIPSTPLRDPATTPQHDKAKGIVNQDPPAIMKRGQARSYALARELSPTRPKKLGQSITDRYAEELRAPKRQRATAQDYDIAVNSVPELEMTYWRDRCVQLESQVTALEAENDKLKRAQSTAQE